MNNFTPYKNGMAHARNEKHGGLELRLIYEISPHMDYQNRWKTACALITNLRNL